MATDYWCRCRDCEYIDPTETKGYKWHCTFPSYKTYEDPDELKKCIYFKKRGSGSSGCFLTTVCCEEKGLPDDCYELTSMRKYRDDILQKSEAGKSIIDFYYKEAPRIVGQINKSHKKKEICDWLYNEICEIIQRYEKGNFFEAGSRYLLMMYQADLVSMGLREIE